MKAKRFLIIGVLFVLVPLLFLANGCKYNVSQPLWDQPYTAPPVPKITSVEPPAATAGVNTITINGENLLIGSDTTWVYFDNTPANIISSSATSIVVYRPNIISDSSKIKIIPHDAIEEAIYSPYIVTSVVQKYGSFLQNLPLSMVAVDDNTGNLYVAEVSRAIHKVTPAGVNTVIASTRYTPTDGKVGPDGNLYLTEKNRGVEKVDVTTGDVSRWVLLPSGKVVSFCDFGDNGTYFYSGGSRTDLVITPFDLSSTSTSSGFYKNDDIQAIRYFNGYIYVASIPFRSTEPAKIWKDQVNSDGSVGDRQLVFDMNTITDSSVINGLAFSQDGKMYISTNSTSDPLLIVDPSTQSTQILYKGILPAYCGGIAFGNSNNLYMFNGNTAASATWTVYQVDMGTKGAPYY